MLTLSRTTKFKMMKKNLLSLISLLAFSLGAAAQTINIGDMSPQIGYVYTQGNSAYISPGESGANQTWDLSGLSSDETFVTTITAPAGLPGATNFPNATFASVISGQDAIGYSAIQSNRIEIVGLYTQTVVMTYPNPQTQLEFPLSYQATYSDTYERSADFGGGILNQETGTTSTLVDGSGTLITPSGTYTDVLRLKQEAESNLATIVNGEVVSEIPFSSTTYVFVKAGYSTPLASVGTSEFATQIEEFATYFISSTVGLDNVSPVSELTIFPVPVVSDFTIRANIESAADVTFSLFSVDGRMVAQLGNNFLPKGEYIQSFSLPENTASGVYFIQIKTPGSVIMEKIVVQ